MASISANDGKAIMANDGKAIMANDGKAIMANDGTAQAVNSRRNERRIAAPQAKNDCIFYYSPQRATSFNKNKVS